MDFIFYLQFFINCKGEIEGLILVIVNWLIKMVYLGPLKITINALGQAEVIIKVVILHHNLFDSIVMDESLVITLSFGYYYIIFSELNISS